MPLNAGVGRLRLVVSIRAFLLREVKAFVQAASKMEGVSRIALLGSLATSKDSPKDADLLVTIQGDLVDVGLLAKLGRRLKGKAQSRNSGADIFLCSSDGKYIGRTCSYKECHYRASCSGTQCAPGCYVCNDLQVINLESSVIVSPPVELWPTFVARGALPEDVSSILSA